MSYRSILFSFKFFFFIFCVFFLLNHFFAFLNNFPHFCKALNFHCFSTVNRNSTIELLNKLNAKYELGFGEVKNKILIFPGGMEFMRVIYELTRLSMQIVLKRNGINDPEQQRYD